jgi:hypothetical protein
MKKLTFLIAALTLLNGDVNAAGAPEDKEINNINENINDIAGAPLALLNSNVNAFGEDDPDYQEKLKQLKTEQAESLQNISTLYQHLQTLYEAEQNKINIQQQNFYFESIIFPALQEHEQYMLKISQLQ